MKCDAMGCSCGDGMGYTRTGAMPVLICAPASASEPMQGNEETRHTVYSAK